MGARRSTPGPHSLARPGHRLGLVCPAFPAGWLYSPGRRQGQKLYPEPNGLCLVKETTLSYVNGKWAGIHCSCLRLLQPRCDGAEESPWDTVPFPHPHSMALCFGKHWLSMQTPTGRVRTSEGSGRHSGGTGQVWITRTSPPMGQVTTDCRSGTPWQWPGSPRYGWMEHPGWLDFSPHSSLNTPGIKDLRKRHWICHLPGWC